MSFKTPRSEVHRLPARGHYDEETIYTILDSNFLCHVSFVMDGKPCIIPTAYGRAGNTVYLHGSVKSRMLAHLATGAEVAIAVTQIDAIVLARSLFHSSMNYQSVVVYGHGREITTEDEKMEGLRIVSESIWPGRWEGARIPDDGELKATSVIAIDIVDGAAKIRTGPAKDNSEDLSLNVWAGLVPVEFRYLTPEADALLEQDMPLPDHVQRRTGGN